MARLNLAAPMKTVAQIGSVIGREISLKLLNAVAKLPERSVLVAVDRLPSSIAWGRCSIPFPNATPERLRYRKAFLRPPIWAIAPPEHSPLKKPIDRALIKITNSAEWRLLEDRFFFR